MPSERARLGTCVHSSLVSNEGPRGDGGLEEDQYCKEDPASCSNLGASIGLTCELTSE